MNSLVAVFIGGGLGSVFRYLLSLQIKNLNWIELPIATLGANILSTLILGLVALTLKPTMTSQWPILLLTVGFCGGFSTFSTFSLETFQLLKNGQLAWAAANVVFSILACLSILFFLSKTIK